MTIRLQFCLIREFQGNIAAKRIVEVIFKFTQSLDFQEELKNIKV